MWSAFVNCIAELDCLCSLAKVSHSNAFSKPIILAPAPKRHAELMFEGLKHPCVEKTVKSFVTNDIAIGGSTHPLALLITGPNMGGKSTILRSVCIGVIMAQIGCFVPATHCTLTPVDRIFTRIGASDRIMENKSTFFIEMEETKSFIEQATSNSLVIVDELGRGTSTFDGFAIASAVLTHLLNVSKSRTLFTTHYHMMLDTFWTIKAVKFMKMDCEVKDEHVTFLYKFVEGGTDDSQGLYVAWMAGLNSKILDIAAHRS